MQIHSFICLNIFEGHKTVTLAIKYTKIQMIDWEVVFVCFHWIFAAMYYNDYLKYNDL